MITLREAARIVSEEAEPYQETSCRPKYLVDAEHIDALRAALSAPRQGEPKPMVAALRPEVAEELIRDGIPPGDIILSAPPTEASGVNQELLRIVEDLAAHASNSLSGSHSVPDALIWRAQSALAQLKRGGTP